MGERSRYLSENCGTALYNPAREEPSRIGKVTFSSHMLARLMDGNTYKRPTRWSPMYIGMLSVQ